MSDFEGLSKKYKKTYYFVVTLLQCDNYLDMHNPGRHDVVCTRIFASEEEAHTFVRNSMVPVIRKSVHANDLEDKDIQTSINDPHVDLDTLSSALANCYPDMTGNSIYESTIDYEIVQEYLTIDTSAFEFSF